MRFLIRLVVCVLAISIWSGLGLAQETRGSIEGVVKDSCSDRS